MAEIFIVKKDITGMHVDAIVNAANSSLAQGGGVCGAIFYAAGRKEMNQACAAIGHCDTGHAVTTPGFHLPASYVIHAAGPIWHGGNRGEEALLYSCYHSALQQAAAHHCRTIAFPLISSGIYGYPLKQAWQTALTACMDFQNDEMKIWFCVIDDAVEAMGKQILNELKRRQA